MKRLISTLTTLIFICSIIPVYAEDAAVYYNTESVTYNTEDVKLLRAFLLNASAEAGKRNLSYLALPGTSITESEVNALPGNTSVLAKVDGLTWNEEGRLISISWLGKPLGGEMVFSNMSALESVSLSDTSISSYIMPESLISFSSVNNPKVTTVNMQKKSNLEELVIINHPAVTSINTTDSLNLLDLTAINCKALVNLITTRSERLENLYASNNPKLTKLSTEGLVSLQTLDVSGCAIVNLDELIHNPLLLNLDVSGNPMPFLSITQNRNLKSLNYSDTKITRMVNHPRPAVLAELGCSGLNLSTIDLKEYTGLEALDVSHNNLTSLTLSTNPGLRRVDYSYNPLKGLVAVPSAASLTELNCAGLLDINEGSKVSFAPYTSLISLDCSNNAIAELDVSKNNKLEQLYASYNKIPELDLSANTQLKTLVCSGSGIEYLDVTANTALEYFDCSFNMLDHIDISNNLELETLICDSNGMQVVSTTNNSNLKYLSAKNNNLAVLNLPNNSALEYLDVTGATIRNIDLPTSLVALYCGNNVLLRELDISQAPKLKYLVYPKDLSVDLSGSSYIKKQDSNLYGGDDYDALLMCNAKSSFTVLSNIKYVSPYAFSNAEISSISVPSNQSDYTTTEGVLYRLNDDGTRTLIAYPRDKKTSLLDLPDNVTMIAEDAFSSQNSFTTPQLKSIAFSSNRPPVIVGNALLPLGVVTAFVPKGFDKQYNKELGKYGNLVNENVTVAVKDDYKVTYRSDGKDYRTTTVSFPSTTVSSLPSISKSGFRFEGWYLDDKKFEKRFTTSTVVTSDTIVFAKWESTTSSSTGSKSSSSSSSSSKKPTATPKPTAPPSEPVYISGFEDGTFRPDDFMTRAQVIRILMTLYNKSTDIDMSLIEKFSDIPSESWAARPAAWAIQNGIMIGGDGQFRPDARITREEVATVLYRLGLKENMFAPSDNTETTFEDTVESWAEGPVRTLSDRGIVRGYPEDNTFKGKNNIMRSEGVTMVSRFAKRQDTFKGNKKFSDVPENHWAYSAIMNAANGT